jgi:hypothetical protein
MKKISTYHFWLPMTLIILETIRAKLNLIENAGKKFHKKTRILRVLHVGVPAAKIRGPKILEVSMNYFLHFLESIFFNRFYQVMTFVVL